MKYYFYTLGIIIFAVIFAIFLPFFTNLVDHNLVAHEVPQNNATVAGVQKYNIPPVSKNIEIPVFSARAVYVKDITTDTVLYQKYANERLPIASTTKIMTALVSSSFYKQNSVLIVGQSSQIPGSRVGLNFGEDLSFRSLLYGMLLNSGNDAAYAIAENYPGGVLGFVSAMNKKVADLNLQNTHFENPAGFDSPNHYSSAKDLSIITEEALKDSQLSRIFATKETSIVSTDKKYTHNLANLNKLLSSVKGVLGVKTGYTDIAKENLVTLVSRDNHRILTVVLGSDDRFGESTGLIEWVYSNFTWPPQQ